ncbi:MAG TPA: hypothetical protein PKH77_27850, partial [Anaerolineae bacterium]|nr:hypothetical protein [Anaerolineae bacterium]
MNYAEWEKLIPEAIRRESLWDFVAYRRALFLYDICWQDCENLLRIYPKIRFGPRFAPKGA